MRSPALVCDDEDAVGGRDALASRQIEHVAARQHDGERLHPRRTVPYLNVAAPAALVATAPPTVAPRYVGTGGNHDAISGQRVLQRVQRHAGAGDHAIRREAIR